MARVPVEPPIHAVRAAVSAALAEDLTPLGDLSAAVVPTTATATAAFRPRVAGVLAGTACATEAFAQLDDRVRVEWHAAEGDIVDARSVVGTVQGPLASILTGERTALNFLCHLSGIATLTRRFAEAAAEGGSARIWDTRKTTPGLRSLEKAAVRAGGGSSHRGNLSDWVMLKDNHLAALGIAEGIRVARDAWPARTIHVEVEDLAGLREALAAGADAILLDNFAPEGAAEAVVLAARLSAEQGKRPPLLECSGGITVETAAAYAATGVDLLSTSQITQSAPALDIGLDIDRDVDVTLGRSGATTGRPDATSTATATGGTSVAPASGTQRPRRDGPIRAAAPAPGPGPDPAPARPRRRRGPLSAAPPTEG